MSENSIVRARIDEATKTEAAAVLAAMGLSLSDASKAGRRGKNLDTILMEVVNLLAANAP